MVDDAKSAISSSSNLQDLLRQRCELISQRHIILFPSQDPSTSMEISYLDLYTQAKKNSSIIRSLHGFEGTRPVLLHLEDHWNILLWFWSVILADGIPVISSPFSNVDEHRRKHIAHLSTLLQSPLCITKPHLIHLFDGEHTVSYHRGLGKHDRSLTYDQLVFILQANWITQALSTAAAYSARVSIAILLIRLFGIHKWFRWYLIAMTILLGASSILYIVITFMQVSPVEALWDILRVDAIRWDPRVWLGVALLYQTFSTITDLTYAVFPIGIIWKLNMPLGRRVALIILMGMSLVTMALSIVLAVELPSAAFATQSSVDVQYGAASTIMYGGLEQSMIIIMGCIPPVYSIMKPHIANIKDFLISSFTRKGKNISASSCHDYTSSGAYQNLELSTTVLGNVDSRRNEYNTIVTCPPRGESDNDSADVNQVRRTNEFALSYE